MANTIAIIKLASGEVGYYDELTNIHLTLSRPTAKVLDYMNTSKLRRSVMNKVLILVDGSLSTVAYARNVIPAEAPKVIEPKKEKIQEVSIPVVEAIKETIVEKVIVPIVKEAIVEETIIEEVIIPIETEKVTTTKKKKKED